VQLTSIVRFVRLCVELESLHCRTYRSEFFRISGVSAAQVYGTGDGRAYTAVSPSGRVSIASSRMSDS